MDLTVKPGDDFYKYASGTWIKNNPVPPKETRWGSFNELREFNIQAVKAILEKAASETSAPIGSVTRRVGDFYTAGMDSATIEKLGSEPVKPILQNINTLSSKEALLSEVSKLRAKGLASAFYGFYVGQDRKDVEHMRPQLSMGGTTLPDRDYYLKNDGRNSAIQEAFIKYISTLFVLVGAQKEKADQFAFTIYELEKKMAEAQLSRVEMRDPYKTYNKFLVTDFSM